MKEMIIPDVRIKEKKGIIEELKDLKNQIRFYDSDDSGGTEHILPGFIQRIVNECKDIIDELSESKTYESIYKDDDNKIRTSKEQISRISEIIYIYSLLSLYFFTYFPTLLASIFYSYTREE